MKAFILRSPLLTSSIRRSWGSPLSTWRISPRPTTSRPRCWCWWGGVCWFLLAAGLVGALFGALTASGMTVRLERVSQVTDAWSQGDFSDFIEDPTGDEISRLTERLNAMAEQLQQLDAQYQDLLAQYMAATGQG